LRLLGSIRGGSGILVKRFSGLMDKIGVPVIHRLIIETEGIIDIRAVTFIGLGVFYTQGEIAEDQGIFLSLDILDETRRIPEVLLIEGTHNKGLEEDGFSGSNQEGGIIGEYRSGSLPEDSFNRSCPVISGLVGNGPIPIPGIRQMGDHAQLGNDQKSQDILAPED